MISLPWLYLSFSFRGKMEGRGIIGVLLNDLEPTCDLALWVLVPLVRGEIHGIGITPYSQLSSKIHWIEITSYSQLLSLSSYTYWVKHKHGRQWTVLCHAETASTLPGEETRWAKDFRSIYLGWEAHLGREKPVITAGNFSCPPWSDCSVSGCCA